MKDLRTAMIQQQIGQYHPNARIVSYQDADADLKFYTEAQLQQLQEDWFPLSCHRDPQTDQLIFGGRGDVAHTYTIGETGAGKTTRFVMQSIRALASMPEKPSFLITDMHGEIIENLYNHLMDNGYTVKILNCDDPGRSDTYNPFAAMAKVCEQTGQIDDECHNMIRKIAEIIQPVQSTQDPIWDMGARSYTHGCILDKFEDLLMAQIPAKCITLYNIIENHYWLRQELGDMYKLNTISHYALKPRTALSVQKIIGVTDNADKTRRSYWGVVENHYDAFGQPTLYRLSSSSTIDVEAFLEKPVAIIVQSGSAACADNLVSLMVNDIYTAIVRKGRQQRIKRLPRPVHCFLDEFANCHIADGPTFIKMLTTSRKFGMHWHMLLQSDSQIERKYDKSISSIVRANCTEIFLGSYDHDTAIRFAASCGKRTVESLSSRLAQQVPSLEVVDLLTPDRMNLMEPGFVYIRSRRHPLLHTYYEAFYNCKEYAAPADMDAIYPHNDFDYRLTAFFPDDAARVSRKEFQVLDYVRSCGTCTETELTAILPASEVSRCLQSLQAKNMITNNNGRIRMKISPLHFELLQEKAQAGILFGSAVAALQEEEQTQTWEEPQCEADDTLLFDAEFADLQPCLTLDALLRLPVADPAELENVGIFTCIPEGVACSMIKAAKGEDPQTLDTKISSTGTLKFEILETFLTNHDFAEKAQWVDALRAEFGRIKEKAWFNEEMHRCIRDAIRELDEDLTLGNIREIKKIISGGI